VLTNCAEGSEFASVTELNVEETDEGNGDIKETDQGYKIQARLGPLGQVKVVYNHEW
jgi:hypothetical protein